MKQRLTLLSESIVSHLEGKISVLSSMQDLFWCSSYEGIQVREILPLICERVEWART